MSAPAGWYADPQDPQLLRYFDGASWTTQTQPAPGAQASSAPGAAPHGPGQQPSWTPQAQQPGQFGQPGQLGQQQGGAQYGQAQGHQPQGQQWQSQQGQPGQYGQQPGQQGWQSGPSPLASQFTAQPRQSGRGIDPSVEGAPSGTPTAVKLWIAGALVAIVAFVGIGLAVDGNREPAEDEFSDALAAVVDDDFDCEALGEQAVLLSETDADPLLSTSGLTPTKDRRSTVEVPETGETVALACRGDGEWSDGSVETIDLELRLDSEGEAWVYYSAR
ncbi:DUF2510 domain-containing protein [Sanguibacter sp. 25GB23B1]|uniref:DUF2510 domain-containing protein n=1 Tax=unclassified Sanguibacter TaxID=2645534 RepID=UPI0032AFFA8D